MATANTEKNKNTVTVTAPAPIAENRNMLFVIYYFFFMFFDYSYIYTSYVISKMSGLSSEFRKLFGATSGFVIQKYGKGHLVL